MKPVWQQSLNVRLNLVGTALNLSTLIIVILSAQVTLRIARIAIWQCKLWQTTGKSREPENQEAGLGFFIGHGGRRQGGLGRGNHQQSLLQEEASHWLGNYQWLGWLAGLPRGQQMVSSSDVWSNWVQVKLASWTSELSSSSYSLWFSRAGFTRHVVLWKGLPSVFMFWGGFFSFWLHYLVCEFVIPQPGIKPKSSTVKAQSANHWTAGEFPIWYLLRFCEI